MRGRRTLRIMLFLIALAQLSSAADYQLTIKVSGKGYVSSSYPFWINCDATCADDYESGTEITLRATPYGNSEFSGWSGACSGTQSTCTVTMSSAKEVTASFTGEVITEYQLTVYRTGNGEGSIISEPSGIYVGSIGSYDYAKFAANTSVKLTASPASNSKFVRWSGDCSTTDGGKCYVTVNSEKQVSAEFAKSGETPAGSCGGLNQAPCNKTVCDKDPKCFYGCREPYASDGVKCVSCSEGMEYDAGRCVVATKKSYTLRVGKTGEGSVKLSGKIDCGSTCSATLTEGSAGKLEATPASGWAFTGWSGTCPGASNVTETYGSCAITVNSNLTVSAVFSKKEAYYNLTVSKEGSGTVTAPSFKIYCGQYCSSQYTSGATVELTAYPDAGSNFEGWKGDCSGQSCTLLMNKDKHVIAVFKKPKPKYTLTVNKEGSGNVTGANFSCGIKCLAEYEEGTVVTLTALPDKGRRFDVWIGACSGTVASCNVTMNAAKNVTARFVEEYSLSVFSSGEGRVESVDPPYLIACGGEGKKCEALYRKGASVYLKAAPEKGWEFDGWTGECAGQPQYCMLLVMVNTNVTANFIKTYGLTVAKKGKPPLTDYDKAGTITSTPDGINCGINCSEASFEFKGTVTLNATASKGHIFDGWKGDCSGKGACTINMTASRKVEAHFSPDYASLNKTLKVFVNGEGVVKSLEKYGPGPINCGYGSMKCEAPYPYGSFVYLSATPRDGWAFDGWNGSCSGQSRYCNVSLSDHTSVTADFVKPYTLTVSKKGAPPLTNYAKAGAITSSPSGIDCGTTCSGVSVEFKGVVTFTATPSKDYVFDGWSGDCSGKGVCTLNVTSNRKAEAQFSLNGSSTEKYLRVFVNGEGRVQSTYSPYYIDCDGGSKKLCDAFYKKYDYVYLRASPSKGWAIEGWEGACAGESQYCTLFITNHTNTTAKFYKGYELTVEKTSNTPAGKGVVYSSPNGIYCEYNCKSQSNLFKGVVKLYAYSYGGVFAGWEGACSGTGECVLNVAGPTYVKARFEECISDKDCLEGETCKDNYCTSLNRCFDGIQNQKEGGIDCGGPCDVPCNNLCSVSNLPNKFSWNNYKGLNWLTPVQNQAGCGSCWAFSAVGALEGKYQIEQNNPLTRLDLSEQNLVSCSDAGDCMGGWPSKAFEYVRNNGIVGETCFKYESLNCTYSKEGKEGKKGKWNPACYDHCKSDGRCALPQTCGLISLCTGSDSKKWKINQFRRIDSDINSVKRAILCFGPLSVTSNNWRHAVVLVGWDDTTKKWIFRNSWGWWWENKGYGTEPYEGGNYTDLKDNAYAVIGVS